MSVTHRVHIVPMGYEIDRVVEPLKYYDAEKVYFLLNTQKGRATDFLKAVTKRLEKELPKIEHESKEVDIFDYKAILELMKEIVRSEEGNEIRINLSSGSSISAVAGAYIAAMVPNLTPYYVRGKYPADEDCDIEAFNIGAEDPEDIPTYPMKKPHYMHLRVLDIISNDSHSFSRKDGRAIRRKHLITAMDDAGILKEITDVDPSEVSNTIRAVQKKVLNPMSDENYITIEQYGKNKIITLTREGTNLLEMFSPVSECFFE